MRARAKQAAAAIAATLAFIGGLYVGHRNHEAGQPAATTTDSTAAGAAIVGTEVGARGDRP